MLLPRSHVATVIYLKRVVASTIVSHHLKDALSQISLLASASIFLRPGSEDVLFRERLMSHFREVLADMGMQSLLSNLLFLR